MEREINIAAGREQEIRLSFALLKISLAKVGEDYLLLVTGGREHLGCTVLAEPRPSLTGEGQSSTSSVLNAGGHKDELLCRPLAEKLAAQKGARVVCTGGFHVDGITGAQLQELDRALDKISFTGQA